MARNLCLFAHFDAFNRVEPYVLRYVEAIHSCDFEVVFISTAMIPDTDCAALLRFCREVIRRPNTGLDFASWATGYAKYGHNFEGELLLANDSVYGPIGKLDDALSRLRALPGDVRGMVEASVGSISKVGFFFFSEGSSVLVVSRRVSERFYKAVKSGNYFEGRDRSLLTLACLGVIERSTFFFGRPCVRRRNCSL